MLAKRIKRISASAARNRRADENPPDARWGGHTPHPPLPGHLLPQGEKELQESEVRRQESGKVSSGYAAGVKETSWGLSTAFSFFSARRTLAFLMPDP
jgi:hypothetical protein